MDAACAAIAGRVAEREDAAVGCDQPVARSVWRGLHVDDRLVEPSGAGAAVAGRVAEGEDTAIAGDQPVTAAVGGVFHRNDRLVEVEAACAAEADRVTEGEDAAVRRDQPVAAAIGRGLDVDDRLVQLQAARAPEAAGGSERIDAAVAARRPVAAAVGRNFESHDRVRCRHGRRRLRGLARGPEDALGGHDQQRPQTNQGCEAAQPASPHPESRKHHHRDSAEWQPAGQYRPDDQGRRRTPRAGRKPCRRRVRAAHRGG